MALKIETFSSLKGGNSFFKAVTHPETAAAAAALVRRLAGARSVAIYDPLGFATGFAALRDLSGVRIDGVYVQAVTDLGTERLGHKALPVTDLKSSGADLVFVTAFDAERLVQQIAHLVPDGARVESLDSLRLDASLLTNPRNYLDPLNFATNFAFFRDRDGAHTRIVTANYWSNYGGKQTSLALTLFDNNGQVLAKWHQPLEPGQSAVVIDSRVVRTRFDLGPFEGQLFIQAVGAAGHDVVKYALDIFEEDGPSLSCTHDANAWPADYYAGLPAPRDDERVVLWVQNSMPIAIPAGGIALNLMGHNHVVAFDREVAPFATVPLDVASLLPDARWPQQIEISAGKYVVRPRYEVTRAGRTRVAHPNVERTDLKPDPKIAELGEYLGKGFILPAPILPPGEWSSLLLPTPMALTQASLPVAATIYDPSGEALATRQFGNLGRHESVALELDDLLAEALGKPIEDAASLPWGHVELTYDFSAGTAVDGWLHALFRYENRTTGHAAETSFGAHVFNTVLTYKDEPQSYAGRPPGLSTRLFLRLGAAPFDTICHLVYPASTPWHPRSSTDLTLLDATGREVARRRVEIPCGGSLFWRYHETFTAEERTAAGAEAYVVIRDATCRLFGYHGLTGAGGRFSLDHMFGF